MNDVLALPTGPLADASLSIAQNTEKAPIADHSIRSFLFARLLAEQEGSVADAAYDEDLLFAACMMHDLGLTSLTHQGVFVDAGRVTDLETALLQPIYATYPRPEGGHLHPRRDHRTRSTFRGGGAPLLDQRRAAPPATCRRVISL